MTLILQETEIPTGEPVKRIPVLETFDEKLNRFKSYMETQGFTEQFINGARFFVKPGILAIQRGATYECFCETCGQRIVK